MPMEEMVLIEARAARVAPMRIDEAFDVRDDVDGHPAVPFLHAAAEKLLPEAALHLVVHAYLGTDVVAKPRGRGGGRQR